MLHYYLADLKRILARIPRMLSLIAIYGLIIAIVLLVKDENFNSIVFMQLAVKCASIGLGFLLGIVELMAVFGDDFKARNMQVAIGLGIRRSQVVLVKWMEQMLLVFLDLVFYLLLIVILGLALRLNVILPQYRELLIVLVNIWIRLTCVTSLTMIFLFYVQSSNLSVLIFLIINSGLLTQLLGLTDMVDWMKKLHISQYTMTSMLDVLEARMQLGVASIGTIAAVLFYALAGYGITVYLFQKKELEF